MDFNKDYYSILVLGKDSTEKEIRKSYYKMSFTLHPDKGGDPLMFNEITEAYDVLMSEKRTEYDKKSKWGAEYDEKLEILDFEFSNMAKSWDQEKFDSWISQNQLNILIYIDDSFDGKVEFDRWVMCKDCGGDGKDTKSKIQIKDENGNLLKLFDGADGCDFCEGTGKNSWNGETCYFCSGKGKVGWTDCKTCKGTKRILGKQKLKGIKFPSGEKAHEIKSMGHFSQFEVGKVGSVWLIRKES
jgi:DnaJ family protein A protein 2